MTTIAIGRGKGLLFDKPELDKICGPARSTGEHFGAPRNLPPEAMAIANALPAPKNQGDSSTCVGHGIDYGAEARLLVQGMRIRSSSPLAICTLARQLAKLRLNEKLTDDGAYMRLGMQGAADFGVPPEEEWPLWRDGKIVEELNDELPPDVLQRASSWKLHEQFKVYGTGQTKLDSVCIALVQKYPLPCAGTIDQAFENYDGNGVLPAPNPDKLTGGHCTCILGYRTNAQGKREFLVYSSWIRWGMSGQLAWVSEEWVLAMQEIYAFTLTAGPRAQEIGREPVAEETEVTNAFMASAAEGASGELPLEDAPHTPRSGEVEPAFDASKESES